MKKITVFTAALLVAALPLFGMGNTSNLKAKSGDVKSTETPAGDEREMIKSAELLENYDVLVNLDFFENYKYGKNTGDDGDKK